MEFIHMMAEKAKGRSQQNPELHINAAEQEKNQKQDHNQNDNDNQ